MCVHINNGAKIITKSHLILHCPRQRGSSSLLQMLACGYIPPLLKTKQENSGFVKTCDEHYVLSVTLLSSRKVKTSSTIFWSSKLHRHLVFLSISSIMANMPSDFLSLAAFISILIPSTTSRRTRRTALHKKVG